MFTPLCQVNQWINNKSFNILRPRSFAKIYLELWLLTIMKSLYRYRHWHSKFPRSVKNLKYEKKNWKLFGFGENICRGWAKISNRKILLPVNFGRVTAHISSEVREKSITKNFVNYKLRPFFVFVIIQCIFSSWTLLPSHFTTFFGGLWNLILFMSE